MDTRPMWTRRKNPAPQQNRHERKGVVAHYVGYGTNAIKWRGKNHKQCLAGVKQIEELHLSKVSEGYVAIAYNLVVCVHGHIIEGRGVNRISGANGSTLTNKRYGSILFLIGDNEEPTRKQKRAFNRASIRLSPNGRAVLVHKGIYYTACPGDRITRWVRNGHKSPPVRRKRGLLTRPLKRGLRGNDVGNLRVRMGLPRFTKYGNKQAFNKKLRKRVERWQEAHGLRVTGVINRDDAEVLGWLWRES